MSQDHLTQIWKWTSITCILFLIASVISIQGGSEFVGKLFGDVLGKTADNRPAVGYFAAIVGGALFLVASCSLALHAKRHGTSWHERVPVVWLEGMQTSSWEGRVFQVFMLLIFVGLPAACVIKCIAEAEVGDICELDTSHFYKGSDTTLSWPPTAMEGKQMRLRREGAGAELSTDAWLSQNKATLSGRLRFNRISLVGRSMRSSPSEAPGKGAGRGIRPERVNTYQANATRVLAGLWDGRGLVLNEIGDAASDGAEFASPAPHKLPG